MESRSAVPPCKRGRLRPIDLSPAHLHARAPRPALFGLVAAPFAGAQIAGARIATDATETLQQPAPALLQAQDSSLVADNDACFQGTDMPQNASGFLLAARSVGFVAHPGGSPGNLCPGPDFGRGVSTGIFNSGACGTATVVADLTSMPTSTGPVAAMAGEARFVQAWYRDSVGGSPTSSLSNAVGFSIQ